MAKYKAYPEYKNSGVEWLGDVPLDWISTQVKYGYSVTLGKMLQKESKSFSDEFKPYLKAQNIQPEGIDVTNVEWMWFSLEERRSLLLAFGDVLVSEGGDVGRTGVWKGEIDECYIQNAINRVRSNENGCAAYFYYWMAVLKSSEYINTLCNKATIAHYTVDKLKSSPLFLPSLCEQKVISSFLEYETGKIDSLIKKQQQMIELLQERRTALISATVTGKIDVRNWVAPAASEAATDTASQEVNV